MVGFLIWWVKPQRKPMGFSVTKNDQHLGVWNGGFTHHFKETLSYDMGIEMEKMHGIWKLDGGNSIIFVVSLPIWRKLPLWLICFKQVGSTTTQKTVYLVCFLMMFDHFRGKTGWLQHFFCQTFDCCLLPLRQDLWQKAGKTGQVWEAHLTDGNRWPFWNAFEQWKRDPGCLGLKSYPVIIWDDTEV